jgi:hypothetical protein
MVELGWALGGRRRRDEAHHATAETCEFVCARRPRVRFVAGRRQRPVAEESNAGDGTGLEICPFVAI